MILDGVEVIGEGAFNGCSALEEVTAPASITVVEQNAFNDCSLLATIRSASFEQMDRWTDDFSGNSNFQVISTIKDTRSPYQVYLDALSTLQRHIDNYTMTSTSKTYLIQQGMEFAMLETQQTIRNNQKNFYSYQREIDHMSGGISS